MMLMVLAAFPAENATVPMKVKLMLLVPPSHLNADHGNIFSLLGVFWVVVFFVLGWVFFVHELNIC